MLVLKPVAGTAQDTVVVILPQFALDMIDCVGLVQVGRVSAQDTDGIHGV